MSKGFSLNKFDVVSIEKQKSPLGAATFTVQEMTISLVNRMGKEFTSSVLTEWVGSGLECEVLRADGKGWQSGKVRITLEFIPDEPEEAILLSPASDEPLPPPGQPESPLDDLRAELNLNNE